MEIGKMTVSQAMPYLNNIASTYGLRLNRVKEFKLARFILANLYNQ
jgi:hypothetical protein